MEARACTAHRQLAEVTRRYAALVRRGNRTVSLLNGHYRGFLDGFGSAGQSPSTRHTWSSEV